MKASQYPLLVDIKPLCCLRANLKCIKVYSSVWLFKFQAKNALYIYV